MDFPPTGYVSHKEGQEYLLNVVKPTAIMVPCSPKKFRVPIVQTETAVFRVHNRAWHPKGGRLLPRGNQDVVIFTHFVRLSA